MTNYEGRQNWSFLLWIIQISSFILLDAELVIRLPRLIVGGFVESPPLLRLLSYQVIYSLQITLVYQDQCLLLKMFVLQDGLALVMHRLQAPVSRRVYKLLPTVAAALTSVCPFSTFVLANFPFLGLLVYDCVITTKEASSILWPPCITNSYTSRGQPSTLSNGTRLLSNSMIPFGEVCRCVIISCCPFPFILTCSATPRAFNSAATRQKSSCPFPPCFPR